MTPDKKQLELNLEWLRINDPSSYLLAVKELK